MSWARRLAALLSGLLLFGCAGPGDASGDGASGRPASASIDGGGGAVASVAEEPAATRGLIAADPVVWAMPGVRLAIPVRTVREGAPPRRVRVRTQTGERVWGEVVWIGVEPDASAAEGWLPDPGRWVSGPPRDVRRAPGFGRHFVLLDLPEGARGQDVYLGENRVRLTWLAEVGVRDDVDPRTLAAPLDDERRRNRALARLARPERLSPIRRWRYLLTTGRLAEAPVSPPTGSAAGVASAGGRFGDVAIETLARQTEARWRAALVGLHALDAELALAVRRRLSATVRFDRAPGLSEEVVIAPAWPVDQVSLEGLLTDLLDPALDPALRPGVRRERAAQWLAEQPAGMGWVIADAAGLDAVTSEPFAGVVLANLTGEDAVASLSAPGGAPGLAPAAPERAVAMSVASGSSLSLSVGEWRARRASRGAAAVSPPGLATGPFFFDWTLEASVRGEAEARRSPVASAAAAVLYRDTDDPFAASVRDGWRVFIECHSPRGVSDDEFVRVWFGPMGAATGSVRVSASGDVVSGGEGSRVVWNAADVEVVRGDREWSVRLPAPPVLVGEDGLLLIGFERSAGGVRQSWPRPMLPWQTEPGRVGADVRAWSGAG